MSAIFRHTMQRETIMDENCNHIYGHSSLYDSLIYDIEKENKCIEEGQLYDCTYPYTIFLYCPLCGTRLKRK